MDSEKINTQQVTSPTVSPDSPPNPAPSSVNQAKPPVSKKKKIIIIVSVVASIIAILGVVGALAYFNSPHYLLRSAVNNFAKENTHAGHYSFTEKDATLAGDFVVRTEGNNGETIVGIGKEDARIGLTFRVVDKSLYFRADSLANFGRLMKQLSSGESALYEEAFTEVFKNIDRQWFAMGNDEIKSYAETAGRGEVEGTISPADLKKLQEIYNRHQFMKPDQSYADETVAGEKSAHFTLKVDKKELTAFMKEVKAANIPSIAITDKDIAEAEKEADKLSKIGIDIWVARSSKRFTQLTITTTEEGKKSTFTATRVRDLPKLEKLEKPNEAKPLSELMTTLIGGSSSSAETLPPSNDSFSEPQ